MNEIKLFLENINYDSLIYGFFVFMIILVVFIILKVFINEIQKQKWIKTIDVNDNCDIIHPNIKLKNQKIIDMDDDNVTVEIKINKRWIYPTKDY